MSSTGYGFYVYQNSNSNNLTSDNASSSAFGFYMNRSNLNQLYNDIAFNNSNSGLVMQDSNQTLVQGMHLYNNSADILVENTSSPMSLNLSAVIFDNPAGSMQNYTNLSINDSMASGETYSISWASNSSSLPAGKVSFAQKFVNISTISGTPSIDSIVWTWLSSELTGYNVSRFQLWKYNSSGWTRLNSTPNNALSLSGMNPLSIYGILQDNDTTPPVVNLISPVSVASSNVSTVGFTFKYER